MSVNSKMTAIANEIRELSGTTGAMGLDDMASNLGDANDEVVSQSELIEDIVAALEGKAIGGGETVVDDVSKAMIYGTITEIEDDTIANIGNYAFFSYSSLTTANFPSCMNIGVDSFCHCYSLTTVNFPVCKSIGSYAFGFCSSLQTVSFPACISTYFNAFYKCTSLTTANFPVCTNIGTNVFGECYRLTTVSFPACTSIGINAFGFCSSLQTVSFPACISIGQSAFSACRKLSAIYLGASSVCTLSNSNAFSSTPFAGYSASFSGTPRIYVPASLVDAYKSATNWVYFSSYITAMEVE